MWFGDSGPFRAIVAWPIITSPTLHGGLGIVDLLARVVTRVLFGKLIVRGLLPCVELCVRIGLKGAVAVKDEVNFCKDV